MTPVPDWRMLASEPQPEPLTEVRILVQCSTTEPYPNALRTFLTGAETARPTGLSQNPPLDLNASNLKGTQTFPSEEEADAMAVQIASWTNEGGSLYKQISQIKWLRKRKAFWEE